MPHQTCIEALQQTPFVWAIGIGVHKPIADAGYPAPMLDVSISPGPGLPAKTTTIPMLYQAKWTVDQMVCVAMQEHFENEPAFVAWKARQPHDVDDDEVINHEVFEG